MAIRYSKSRVIKGYTFELQDELMSKPAVVVARDIKTDENNEVLIGVSFIDEPIGSFRQNIDRWVSPCNLRAHNIW